MVPRLPRASGYPSPTATVSTAMLSSRRRAACSTSYPSATDFDAFGHSGWTVSSGRRARHSRSRTCTTQSVPLAQARPARSGWQRPPVNSSSARPNSPEISGCYSKKPCNLLHQTGFRAGFYTGWTMWRYYEIFDVFFDRASVCWDTIVSVLCKIYPVKWKSFQTDTSDIAWSISPDGKIAHAKLANGKAEVKMTRFAGTEPDKPTQIANLKYFGATWNSPFALYYS